MGKAVLKLEGSGLKGCRLEIGLPQRYVPARGLVDDTAAIDEGFDHVLVVGEGFKDAILLPLYPTDGGIEIRLDRGAEGV